jgi:hypothetical protein
MMAARADQHARQRFSTSKTYMQAYRAKDCDERHNGLTCVEANISIAADIRSDVTTLGPVQRPRKAEEKNA